jgi:hypothetical protein
MRCHLMTLLNQFLLRQNGPVAAWPKSAEPQNENGYAQQWCQDE